MIFVPKNNKGIRKNMKYLIIGSGRMAMGVVHDLLNLESTKEVHVTDREEEALEQMNSKFKDDRLYTYKIDADDKDRIIPLIEPFVELRDGRCRHPVREETKKGKVVLVSNCGFWEMDNFDPLLVHMQAMCKNADRAFAGALLRPHGPALKGMLEMGLPVNDVVEAATEAGRQLVEEGAMSAETLHTVSRELLSRDRYVENLNQRFRQALEGVGTRVTR